MAQVPGYIETVSAAWNKPISVQNPFLRLHSKLQRTGKALRLWAKALIGPNKLLLLAAKQLIWILDIVEEHRSMSTAEILLRRDVKHRFLSMTAVEKLRAKQQSRISFLRAREANSKLFFMAINGRKRKNFIQSLETPHGLVHLHKDKEQEIYNHFNGLLGNQQNRSITLDWGRLGLHRHDL